MIYKTMTLSVYKNGNTFKLQDRIASHAFEKCIIRQQQYSLISSTRHGDLYFGPRNWLLYFPQADTDPYTCIAQLLVQVDFPRKLMCPICASGDSLHGFVHDICDIHPEGTIYSGGR